MDKGRERSLRLGLNLDALEALQCFLPQHPKLHFGGRLKQWLAMMRRHYPEAEALYGLLRPIKGAADIDAAMVAEGLLTPERLAA